MRYLRSVSANGIIGDDSMADRGLEQPTSQGDK